MNTLVALLALVAVAFAAPAEEPVAIVRQTQDVGVDGSYNWAFETANGITAEEQGQLKTVGKEQAVAAQGAVSWTSPEGEKVSLSYVADENGYQPTGSHLPVAPPVPEAILRALEYIRTHPAAPEKA